MGIHGLGKKRTSEVGGLGFLIKNNIKTAITIEQHENASIEIV